MKKFSINGQMRNKLFLIIIYRFSLVKAIMAAACVFGTDPNRIGLLGKPPAVKQFLSYKSQ